MQPNKKWAFLYFSDEVEGTRFYDDVKEGIEMWGIMLSAEYALSKDDRELLKLGITKEEIERSRRTVIISNSNIYEKIG